MASTSPTKPRSYRALFIVVALCAVAGLGFFAYRTLKGLELAEAPLANVPKEATAVGHLRFRALVESRVLRLIIEPTELDARLARIREECQLDPTEQLEDVILYSEGETLESLTKLGAIARGPFDIEKLRGCLGKAFESDGLGELEVGEIEGVPAVFPAGSDQRAAFLNRNAVAIGEQGVVGKVIHVVRDRAPNAAADPMLTRIWGKLGVSRDMTLVLRVTSNLRESIRELAANPSAARFRPFVEKVVGLGASVDITSGLKAAVILSMQDDASAAEVVTALTGQLEMLKNSLMVSITPFGTILRSVRVDQQDLEVLVTVDVTEERLESAISFAERWSSNLGERSAPANPQQEQQGSPVPSVVVPAPAQAP